MTIQPFPPSLPQVMDTSGYSEEEADNIIRSKTDMGPAMLRRRTTSNVRPIKGSMLLTSAQRTTLREFYIDILLDGVLRFSWVDQVSGDPVEYRFTKPPKFEVITDDLFKVMLELELLP